MQLFNFLNTLISIAAGLVTISGAVGIYNIDNATNKLEVGNFTIYFLAITGAVIFTCSLVQRKSVNNINTNIKSQNQFGGSGNSQHMS